MADNTAVLLDNDFKNQDKPSKVYDKPYMSRDLFLSSYALGVATGAIAWKFSHHYLFNNTFRGNKLLSLWVSFGLGFCIMKFTYATAVYRGSKKGISSFKK